MSNLRSLPTASKPVLLWSALQQYLNARVGIAGRLGLSFAAVATLAAIANVLVAQGISIISRPTSNPVVIAAVPPEKPAAEVAIPAPKSPLNADRLREAIDRYDRSVRASARTASPEDDAQRQAAELALDQLSSAFLTEAKANSELHVRDLNLALAEYRATGSTLLVIAARMQAEVADYAAEVESMNGSVKKAIDSAWKIFGRVVARQSLLQLRDDLEEIRRRFATLRASPAIDAAGTELLAQSEKTFERTLDENRTNLSRSQGEEWVSSLQNGLSSLTMRREALVAGEHALEAAQARFVVTHDRLTTLVAGLVKRANSQTQAKALAAQKAAAQKVQEPLIENTPELLVTQSSSAAPTPEDGHSRRGMLAWISVAVLLVVLLVSIATVKSIVLPIRRLLLATSSLAKGDAHQPVPRGGIKELDILAVSFNQMGTELTAARESMVNAQADLEKRVAERTVQLQELAERDPLTGLPNRRHLRILLDNALGQASANKHLVGVFFLDLDNFKNINDSLGHAFGDRILKAIALRLQEVSLDFGFASRLGGDEFTVVLTGGRSVEDVRNAGLRIIAAFQDPVVIDGRELVISVSIGASIYPDHEQTAEGLLRAADAALFRAKALGRSQLSVFTPELLAEAAAKFTTEQGLRRAVERGEFELVYQPEVSSVTLQTSLVEALIRWRLPDGRLLSPGEFLAVAEESGLIVEISDWVLRSAIQTASEWHHGAWPEARVAINVSPRQLLDHRFVERVQGLLEEFRVPARCIEIELTETVLQTGPATIDTLHRLRACGIAIALDDFGTGYSSLASLEKLPFTRIKLDRSLIDGIDTSLRSAAITRAIIGLCHGLGLEVTAEGIERPEQFSLLMEQGPMYFQGYLLSKPVAAGDLLSVMNRVKQEAPLFLMSERNTRIHPAEKEPQAASQAQSA